MHVGIVIEPGDDDLIASPPRRSKGPRRSEGEARHVLPEDDLLRPPTHEIGDRGAACSYDPSGIAGNGEGTSEVAGAVLQVACHRIDDRLRRLGASGTVEVDRGQTAIFAGQCRELGPDPGYVNAHKRRS